MRHETINAIAARRARERALDDYLDHWDRKERRRRALALRYALALICAAWLLSFAVLAL